MRSKSNLFFIAILLFAISSSCDNEEKSYQIVEDGGLKLSVKVNSEIVEEAYLDSDTVRNGWTRYYKNGKLIRKTFFRKGLIHGQDSTFYESGNLKGVERRVEGNLFDEQFTYYDKEESALVRTTNGDTVIMNIPILKGYRYYGEFNDEWLKFEYGLNGDITMSGRSLVEVYGKCNSPIIGDSCLITFKVPMPPKYSSRYKFELYLRSNIIESKYVEVDWKKRLVNYLFRINEKGQYTVKVYHYLYNNDNGKTQRFDERTISLY